MVIKELTNIKLQKEGVCPDCGGELEADDTCPKCEPQVDLDEEEAGPEEEVSEGEQF